jgi:TetR/AcrR family tetracycline transcriptional repressor
MADTADKPAKQRLSRAAIAAQGLRLADAEGVEAVTVRRLAQHFGVTPMALYWHFKDKDQLIDGIAECAFDSLELPPATPDDPWLTELRALLEAFLAAVRPHPAVAPLLPPRVLSGESGLRLAERVLTVLHRAGFSKERAAELGGYLLEAAVALVTAMPGRDLPAEEEAREDAVRAKRAALLGLSARNYPAITGSAGELADCASPDAYFTLGLDVLTAGVYGIASPATVPAPVPK